MIEIKDYLSYDENTGKFHWIKSLCSRVKVGSEAGTINSTGYTVINFNKKIYQAHRLAFIFMNGFISKLDVDHINGVRNDNRYSNLRQVSRMLNIENQRKCQKGNSSGKLGVLKNKKGRFVAQIQINRQKFHIGTFDSADDAHNAYLEKKREFHKGCTI